MRENRTNGSEGGEDLVHPDPYQAVPTNTSAVLNSVVGAAFLYMDVLMPLRTGTCMQRRSRECRAAITSW